MALSRQQTKEWIFEYLAAHFEKTGDLSAITVDEISEKTNTRTKRVQSLLNEMIDEQVIYVDSQDYYRLTPSTFDFIVNVLAEQNRLPHGFNLDTDMPDFPDAPTDINQMLKHFKNSADKQTKPFDEDEAFNLMEQLGEAQDNKNDEEFNRIRAELEAMGCTVRLKANDEFSVLFPPEKG